MKKQLLILMTLFMSVMAYSQVFTVDYITYVVTSTSSNTVKAFSYDTAGGSSVTIPTTVDDNSITYSVTGIHQMSFMNKNLTSVILPNSLTTIEWFAFANNQLSSIVIPDSVMSIAIAAFENNQLISANIPTSLTVIEDQVFRNNQLNAISFHSGITSIGQASFLGNQLTNVTIPSNVTNISSYAFSNNPLTLVTSESTVPPTIVTGGATDTFGSNRSGIDLIIPVGTEGSYVTDPGALWTDFNTVNGVALSISEFEIGNAIKVISTAKTLNIISYSGARLNNYELYDITGSKIAKGSETEIMTNSFSKGIYVLKLNFDKGTVVRKVVVK